MLLTVMDCPVRWTNCVLSHVDGEVRVGKLTYFSRCSDDVPVGCIALNAVQRHQTHTELGSQIEVDEHSREDGALAESMNLLVRSIEEDEYTGDSCFVAFKTLFEGQWMVRNQMVMFQAHDKSFLATVYGITGGHRVSMSTKMIMKYN